MTQTTALLENSPENWINSYVTTAAKLKPAVVEQMKQLNLWCCYSIDDVINDVFLLIYDLIQKEKLIYTHNSNNKEAWFYLKDGIEQSPIKIDSYKAWLRQVFFRHLLKLRAKQNQRDLSVEIDERRDIHSNENPLDFIVQTELIEKISQCLSDEQIEIIKMHLFQGLKFKEIISLLELKGFPKYNEENLRKKYQRAIDRLRAAY